MGKFIDETGNRYGRLTVIRRAPNDKHRGTRWLCKCDCGKECIVDASNLRRGNQVSCGCYLMDKLSKNDVPTEYRATRLYRIWQRMLYRCTNPRSNRYARYGARGIKVCDEWSNDFMKFYRWAVDNGYSDALTIDRIDNDGNYEPSNCRWTTVKEQQRNRVTNRTVTYNGETKCVASWCEQYGLNLKTVCTRISCGWSDPYEILFGRRKKGVVYGN